MASPEIILELLRQAQLEQNAPSQTQQSIAQLSQVMEGVLKGIQLYDAAKGLKSKYGSTTTTTIPGTPDVGVTQPGPSLIPPVSPFASLTAGLVTPGLSQTPSFVPGAVRGVNFPVPQRALT